MSDKTEILLTDGRYATISTIDAERVLKRQWHTHVTKVGGKAYSRPSTHIEHDRVSLARFILNAQHGQRVCHANGNQFDCTRGNLMLLSRANCAESE